MAAVLPLSVSPHVTILPSADLLSLLASASLPPLHHILQSYSPLPQVTTRTTALTPIPHQAFSIRFSHLPDVEAGCKEEEDARAGRMIDWIGGRINRKASRWVEDMERKGEPKDGKTPWWEELKRCAEGDLIPSRTEGWNHPVAIIFAVSTLAPNPLQAVTELHARNIDLPPWVDSTILRYTLIIHPPNSPLSSEECTALLNAVKKQYGLQTHLLNLTLEPPPTPLPILPLLPLLPPPTTDPSESPDRRRTAVPEIPDVDELLLNETDTQNTGRFVREFVTQNLVPWLERYVRDWNETYSSTRRLPSRLFSSTRRLFGSSAPPSPVPASPTVVSTPVAQQRRLAEFATFLGDYKIAMTVWESLRKEGQGGAEVLPLLLSPTKTLSVHAEAALAPMLTPEPPAHVQLRALKYAVRWESGVRDLLRIDGERWLVSAAGNSEEPSSTLLLAHSALLSSRKGAHRRAAMLYAFAANRLEKSGIKPLTVYFLRKAHDIFGFKPDKMLSPSFSDIVGRGDGLWFDSIMPNIEHSLGRLKYTTGDTEGAIRLFLGLLKGSAMNGQGHSDKVFLEDFRLAFEHLRSTAGLKAIPSDLKLQLAFCSPKDTQVRFDRESRTDQGEQTRREELEETWRLFWKRKGKESLQPGGKASVGERFWIDLALRNPLDAEVQLSDLTVVLAGSDGKSVDADVEVIEDVKLGPKENRLVPISVVAKQPGSLKITHLTYNFLSLLHTSESIARRGRRLNETAIQRQGVVYGPDILLSVEVRQGGRNLVAQFSSSHKFAGVTELALGESSTQQLKLQNHGSGEINEIWMVGGEEVGVWVQLPDGTSSSRPFVPQESVTSPNHLAPDVPFPIPIEKFHSSPVLKAGESFELPIVLHALEQGGQSMTLLFVFREENGPSFFSKQICKKFEVKPLLDVTASVKPAASREAAFVLKLEMENTSEDEIDITQVSTVSPSWTCKPISHLKGKSAIPPRQVGRFLVDVDQWTEQSGIDASRDFVQQKAQSLLQGTAVSSTLPPSTELFYSHVASGTEIASARSPYIQHVVHSIRRHAQRQNLAAQFPQIPLSNHPSIFPLYSPHTLDVVIFWNIPSENRSGHILLSGLSVGPGHGALREAIEAAEASGSKRSMYAETQREREAITAAFRVSEWNIETDPVVVRVQARERIEHDFRQGPFVLPVTFTLRNYSPTHPSRYSLQLASDAARPSFPTRLIPAKFSGRLTHRGILQPLAKVSIETKVLIPRAGMYGVGGWKVDSEVGEPGSEPWRVRTRFSQTALKVDERPVIAVDIPISS